MINKNNFKKEYIEKQIKKFPKVDPIKMEMAIFAFGLLDELIRCGLPLIFKGGTSLLLLLDNPRRVSTDIDIIVPPNIDFDKTFEKVKKRFPFYEGEERGYIQNKFFRHFYFMFTGPISEKECRINLDVALEDNPYPNVIKKEVSIGFLETSGEKTYVKVPTHECILGDKLTAFAPTTIGVNPYMSSLGKEIDNRLQVMKQFYDIARLYEYIGNFNEVFESYKTCQNFENKFRNTNYSIRETLLDTFNHAAEIASMGQWNKNSIFYKDVARIGIQGLATNIFDGKYNAVLAANDAAKVMFICACLLTNNDIHNDQKIDFKNKKLQCFKGIQDTKSFELIRKSLALLNETKII